MNVPQILKTLRMRDKQIADALGIKVAQIGRRQKQIQQPSDDNKVKLKEFIENHILDLQRYLDGETATPIATNEPEPQLPELTDTTLDIDTQENDEEPETEPEEEIKPTRKPRYNE